MATKQNRRWKTLDKDLSRISMAEQATATAARPLVKIGLTLVLAAIAATVAMALSGAVTGMATLVLGLAAGLYMALSIGANDVANAMGPPVGAGALRVGQALFLAALAEIAGAVFGGQAVTDTLTVGIITPETMLTGAAAARMMMAALLAAATWIMLATLASVPISTTHAVVGGILGAGLVSFGADAVNWGMLFDIALVWMIAPVLAAACAAAILAAVQGLIERAPDRTRAMRRGIPLMIGIMAGLFACYLSVLLSGGRGHPVFSLLTGLVCGAVCWALARPVIRRQIASSGTGKATLKLALGLPLAVAAVLVSFAHGANDVANVAAPLSVILRATGFGAPLAAMPLWVALIGALGVAAGILILGRRLVIMVGTGITRLSPIRAFCIACATALTVIIASWAGWPVSTTHITIGGVFGVGYWRERDDRRQTARRNESRNESRNAGDASARRKDTLPPEELHRRRLVRWSHLVTMLVAWVVTVPISAALAAGLCAISIALSANG
ncbi:inorganic phosphate transporter [Paracoccus pacificus]|uniref:Phosphate transporter n=1 Tax=Paracoccus pacificus TaxID=1463598 RepID=A0ABW4RA97_9RHOB